MSGSDKFNGEKSRRRWRKGVPDRAVIFCQWTGMTSVITQDVNAQAMSYLWGRAF